MSYPRTDFFIRFKTLAVVHQKKAEESDDESYHDDDEEYKAGGMSSRPKRSAAIQAQQNFKVSISWICSRCTISLLLTSGWKITQYNLLRRRSITRAARTRPMS